MKRSPRRPRGWVLIAVLLMLAVLSMLVAGFFVEASDSEALQQTGAARLMAEQRAELGLQEAVRALRARQLDLSSIIGTCTDAQVDDLTCPMMFSSPMDEVDPGSGRSVLEGAGLQHQYFIYRRTTPADIGLPANRFVIRAVGYAGHTLTSANLVSSVVEAEVDIGEGTGYRCIGGYECQ